MDEIRDITESVFEISEIEEVQGKPKTFKASGVFLKTDIPTLNKRLYPKSIVSKALESFFETSVKSNSAFSLNGHPAIGSVPKPTDAVARITNIKLVGDDVYGEMLVFDTSDGKDIQAIMKSGSAVGISLRGAGTLSQPNAEGIASVQNDFKFLGFDLVLNPASQGSGLNSYNYEHKGGEQMTLEELKKANPEIFASFEADIRKSVEEEMTKKCETMKEEIAKEIIAEMAEAKKKAAEDDEPVGIDDDGMVECPKCGASFEVESVEEGEKTCEAVEKELADTKEELKKTKEALESTTVEKVKLESEKNELEVKKFMSETLDKNPLKDVILEKVGSPKTKEGAKEAIDKEIKFIESVATKKGIKNFTSEGMPDSETERNLRLAGVEKKN